MFVVFTPISGSASFFKDLKDKLYSKVCQASVVSARFGENNLIYFYKTVELV
jgi:hypothetical protein